MRVLCSGMDGGDVEGEVIGGEFYDADIGRYDLKESFTVRCDDGEVFQIQGWSFLVQYGYNLAGTNSPAAFAQQLINNHFNSGNAKTGDNPNFFSDTVTGINMVIRRKGC